MWRAAASALKTAGVAATSVIGPHATVPCGLAPLPSTMLVPLQVRWAKKSKRKKRPKMSERTPEQIAVSCGAKERIWDNVMESETAYKMSMTIRQHMRGLLGDGRHNIRRKKDFSRYTNYRVMRITGQTHDNPTEDIDRRGVLTPLTQLQDNSHLPRSVLHRRFNFPHTLNYKAYWGPPTVMHEPNEYEGSMVGCSVSIRLRDLPLTQKQKERLVEIVGSDRIDEETGVVTIEADTFPERNHNAALLGDMLEQLMREVTSVEPHPHVASSDDAPAATLAAEAKAST